MTEKVAARHWRLREMRLGNNDKWGEIVRFWQENNPHLGLAQLASFDEKRVREVHERKKKFLSE